MIAVHIGFGNYDIPTRWTQAYRSERSLTCFSIEFRFDTSSLHPRTEQGKPNLIMDVKQHVGHVANSIQTVRKPTILKLSRLATGRHLFTFLQLLIKAEGRATGLNIGNDDDDFMNIEASLFHCQINSIDKEINSKA